MKLIYRILIHLSLALPIILAAWGILFYMAIIDEVNDEVDDSLEDYSEVLITRALAGEQLPSQSDGSNNSYYLITVTADMPRNRNGSGIPTKWSTSKPREKPSRHGS